LLAICSKQGGRDVCIAVQGRRRLSEAQPAGRGQHAGELQDFVTEYESLDAQVSDLRRDQKDLMTVAKSKGFNTKALRRLLAERKRDAGELQEEQEIVAMYRKLLL
jgi:uncharacterized protein (UPF0335 family)